MECVKPLDELYVNSGPASTVTAKQLWILKIHLSCSGFCIWCETCCKATLKYCKRNKVNTNKQTNHHHLAQKEAPKISGNPVLEWRSLHAASDMAALEKYKYIFIWLSHTAEKPPASQTDLWKRQSFMTSCFQKTNSQAKNFYVEIMPFHFGCMQSKALKISCWRSILCLLTTTALVYKWPSVLLYSPSPAETQRSVSL